MLGGGTPQAKADRDGNGAIANRMKKKIENLEIDLLLINLSVTIVNFR